jgi:trehalose 6-phosphate phosphatase
VLDFDGTLAEIVDRPELARPAPGVREALIRLVERFRLVAILTGRRSEETRALLEIPGLEHLGLYGSGEGGTAAHVAEIRAHVDQAVADVPQAWVEDKGVSLAVHYRQASDPVAARTVLLEVLRPIAEAEGLELVEGKMVLELLEARHPMKGAAVERLVGEHALEGILYAGDDVADLDAFSALERLGAAGLVAVRVAVRGDETPTELVDAADVVVDGPAGLVGLLERL